MSMSESMPKFTFLCLFFVLFLAVIVENTPWVDDPEYEESEEEKDTAHGEAEFFDMVVFKLLAKKEQIELDHLPEVAFYMVGGIEEVVQKAEKLAEEQN
uniref:Uncharacterized protein n=1 Tax=Romanomermis culicivorax TaxID=13658 RepID=A0A915KU46_ROMCU